MKKIFLSLIVILTFCFAAAAQFNFTSKAGKKFGAGFAPQKSETRGGGFVMEYYYAVEGSDLVVYEVGKQNGALTNSIAVIKVPLAEISSKKFKVMKNEFGCYLQTGTAFTKITHGADYNAGDTYSNDNLQLNFSNCAAADALRVKVLGDAADELDLSDLDLDLDDKPKEKPKSKMPAHLFALLGEGSRGTYQFNRKNMEVWDYKTNNVFKVGKIANAGGELKMLNADESYFTYRVKDGKLYNGNKFLGIELIAGDICKSYNDEKCFGRFAIDRDDESIYSVFEGGKRFKQYSIKGEATDEEILLIFAYLEKF